MGKEDIKKRVKLVQTIPHISAFSVLLNGIIMDGKQSKETIEFRCDTNGEISQAIGKHFCMGRFFFKEHFTKEEEKNITILCKEEINRVKEALKNSEW